MYLRGYNCFQVNMQIKFQIAMAQTCWLLKQNNNYANVFTKLDELLIVVVFPKCVF